MSTDTAVVALPLECQLAVAHFPAILFCPIYSLLYSGAALALPADHALVQAISRCHFEETDPESDELVLMKVRHSIHVENTVLLVQTTSRCVTKRVEKGYTNIVSFFGRHLLVADLLMGMWKFASPFNHRRSDIPQRTLISIRDVFLIVLLGCASFLAAVGALGAVPAVRSGRPADR